VPDPYPNLLHPTGLLIAPIARNATLQDDLHREPVQTVAYNDSFPITGQVELRRDPMGGIGSMKQTAGGFERGEMGYVLLRRRDMEAVIVTYQNVAQYALVTDGDILLPLGSRIHWISGRSGQDAPQKTTVYIWRYQQMGHYPQHGWTLVRCYFSDRKPSRQS